MDIWLQTVIYSCDLGAECVVLPVSLHLTVGWALCPGALVLVHVVTPGALFGLPRIPVVSGRSEFVWWLASKKTKQKL